jgi:acetyl esterase
VGKADGSPAELNQDSRPFWELPGPQVRASVTGLQAKTPVALSGVSIAEQTITAQGRPLKLSIVKPDQAAGTGPSRS